jgi:hypothetical protein
VALPSQRIPPGYADLGPAPKDLPAGRVLLFLQRPAAQQARLDALVREQNDPGSPQYRRFLTPAQFGEQFGPSEEAVRTVTQWLAGSGFTVTRTLQSRIAIEFTATVPQLETAFQTEIHAFSSASNAGKVVYANTSSPLVPEGLAGLVKGVSLSSFGPRPLHRSLGSFLLQPGTNAAAPLRATQDSGGGAKPLFNETGLQPCATTGVCYALVPGDYATIYDTKPLLTQGIDGTGVTIGIASTSNIDLPTVQRFRTLFLPQYAATNLPNVIVDGADPGLENLSGAEEAYVDVETAAGTAPNATINLYVGANSEYTNGLTLALARAVEDDTISILSVSYGECESYLGSYNSVFEDFYEEAAAQGITVVVSAGDTGAAGCDPGPNTSVSGPYQAQYGFGVSGLATTPYNIAVGGTDFVYPANVTAAQLDAYWKTPSTNSPNNNADWSSALSYIPEKPWDDSDPVLDQLNIQTFAGGGGGQSFCAFNNGAYPVASCQGGYPKPSWQQGFGNDTVRDIPDVSLFAAIGSNYSFYGICMTLAPDLTIAGSTPDCAVPNAGPNSTTAPIVISGIGGTSVSAPMFAGMLALVAQKTQTARLGLATPTLYPLSKQFPAAFHDIATGTNATACASGSPDCGTSGYLTGQAAVAGYDLATGLGSVDAKQLVSNWGNVAVAAQSTATTLALTPTTGPHETVVTFTVNVTGASSNPASGTIAVFGGTTSTIQTTQACAAFPCVFTFNALPGGSYPVTARFLADGVYASSTSNAVNVTISAEASEVLILNAFSNNQIYPPNGLNGQTNVQLGESVGFLIAPEPATTPAGTPFSSLTAPPATGTVTITDAGTAIGPAVRLDSTGLFNFVSSAFGLGQHSLVVQYSGDASYLPSSTVKPVATPLNFTVIKAVPTLFAYGLPSYGGVAVGYPIPLNLYVGGVSSGNGQTLAEPSGTVTLTVNGTVLPPLTLGPTTIGESTAIATIPGNLIVLGANTIVVSYGGDANYSSASTSLSATGIVFQTYSDLGAIPTTTSAGLPITFYPEVFRNYQQAYPQTIPTNVVVTLLDGSTPFATVPLATDTSRISADGTFAYSGLSVGTHTITMQYPGDSGDLPSSATLSVVITPGIPSFTVAATPISFASGASSPSAVSTLTITPVNGFTGAVSLSCSAAALPGGSCSVASSATVTGASPATVSVAVSLRGITAQLSRPRGWTQRGLPVAAWLCLGFALCGVRRRARFARVLMVVATAALLAGLSACGSASNTLTVAAGTYNVTIQATSGGISKTATIPVSVQ